jgi:predicted site-specific integrase-resolvase
MATLLTPSQAARILGMSPQGVVLLARKGKLPCQTTPLGRLFDANQVEQLANERQLAKEGRA